MPPVSAAKIMSLAAVVKEPRAVRSSTVNTPLTTWFRRRLLAYAVSFELKNAASTFSPLKAASTGAMSVRGVLGKLGTGASLRRRWAPSAPSWDSLSSMPVTSSRRRRMENWSGVRCRNPTMLRGVSGVVVVVVAVVVVAVVVAAAVVVGSERAQIKERLRPHLDASHRPAGSPSSLRSL